MPRASYKKPTSKRALRELYQEQIAALAPGDPQRTRLITLLARLEGHDTRARAVDYPEREHSRKPEPEPERVERAEDEELMREIEERTTSAEIAGRAWAAHFAGKPLPEDTPDYIREYIAEQQQKHGKSPLGVE